MDVFLYISCIVGWLVVCALIYIIKKPNTQGKFTIDFTNVDKDVCNLELCDLEIVAQKKYITLKVETRYPDEPQN